MYKLKKNYNQLSSFDKLFFESYYQLKFTKKSQRWYLFQIIKKKGDDLEENIFDSEIKDKKNNKRNKCAISQLKRRFRFDIESILLLRILNDSKVGVFASRFFCYRFLILAAYYLEIKMLGESQKKLNQAFKIIMNKDFLYERLAYNELQGRLFEISGSCMKNNRLLEDSLSTVRAIELKLINDIELTRIQNSNLNQIQLTKEKLHSGLNKNCGKENMIHVRDKMLKEWSVRNYTQAIELAKEEYEVFKTSESNQDDLCIECLLHIAYLNVYAGRIMNNFKIFEIISAKITLNESFSKDFFKVQFKTYFLNNCLEKCQDILIDMQSVFVNSFIDMDKGVVTFLNGLLLFKNGKYLEVSKLLRDEIFLFSLPDNIGLNVRLLELYTLIMNGEYRLCSYKLEAFRQVLMRSKSIVVARYMHIERILYCFLSNEMDVEIVLNKIENLKRKYGDDNNRFKQDIEGYELISIEHFIAIWKKMNQLNKICEEIVI